MDLSLSNTQQYSAQCFFETAEKGATRIFISVCDGIYAEYCCSSRSRISQVASTCNLSLVLLFTFVSQSLNKERHYSPFSALIMRNTPTEIETTWNNLKRFNCMQHETPLVQREIFCSALCKLWTRKVMTQWQIRIWCSEEGLCERILDFEAYLLLNFQKNAFLSFLTEKTW